MIERQRTTKYGPITSDMSWEEVLLEYKKLNENNDDVMSLSTEERIRIGGAMFAENDHKIVSSFPKNISEREYKERLYFGRYSEHLPEDFFKDKK